MRPEYREQPCGSALNRVKGMGFEWSLNPYMGCSHRCTFCYVRAFEKRADRPSDDRYGRSIRVKINVVEVLRAELARPGWKRDPVVIGAATDPYQPAEGRYRLTRRCLEALAESRTPFSIITRGTLIVRDLDVLQHAARRAKVSVNFSVPTLDERVWRATEPSTPHPRQRLRALRMLVEGGIRAGVGMAPILPGISDRPEQLAEVVRAARAAGACGIWADVVNLRPGTREHFLAELEREWPGERAHYERLFAGRHYLPSAAGDEVRQRIKDLRVRFGVGDRRRARLAPPPEVVQLEMAI